MDRFGQVNDNEICKRLYLAYTDKSYVHKKPVLENETYISFKLTTKIKFRNPCQIVTNKNRIIWKLQNTTVPGVHVVNLKI